MKNRNLENTDNWATPDEFYRNLDRRYNFAFDPCPFNHDIEKWNGLDIPWGETNFVNPPYSRKLKEAFVLKAIEESKLGKTCVCLLPVSTSTKLFHDHIRPNAKSIDFIRGRLRFKGINTKGEYVNFNKEDDIPDDAVRVSNSGMHDSMLVVF